MAINPMSTSTQSGLLNTKIVVENESNLKRMAMDKPQIPPVAKFDTYEKTEQTAGNVNTTYTRDSAKLGEISRKVEEKLAGLRGIVENLITMQSLKTGESQGLNYDQIMKKYEGNLKSFYQNLEVDDATRIKAQEEISEDGFWGVKQTAKRAIDFAISLSGGDTSKLAILKDSVEKGYAAAEKAWGGELPEISQQTKAATLKGLDDWARGAV